MSTIRELSLSEVELVSGGSANGQDNNERSNYGGNRARTNYGGQANGFQPNYAAAGGTGSCGLGTVAGLVAGITAASVATGGLAAGVGFVGGLASGMIGGQCFPSGSSSSNSKSGPPFR